MDNPEITELARRLPPLSVSFRLPCRGCRRELMSGLSAGADTVHALLPVDFPPMKLSLGSPAR